MANLNIKFNNKTYLINSAALADAMALLEGHFISMTNGSSEPSVAGLYQTGAVALYEEQGAGAIEGMLITPWDNLLINGTITVNEGTASCADDTIAGDLFFPNDGSITALSDSTFCYCNLTGVVIFEGIANIMGTIFQNCANLTNVVIPEGVTKISGTFYNCPSLESVTLPKSVTSIGINAFTDCPNLVNIVIPDGVTSIGKSAFESCESLTGIGIPDSVTSIGVRAFFNCSGLTSIVIPEGVATITSYAFSSCESLTSIVIPESVTSIDADALSECTSLASIVIPKSVTKIGANAFFNCSRLTSINFEGTKQQWGRVTKGTYWKKNAPATHVHCTDGDVAL